LSFAAIRRCKKPTRGKNEGAARLGSGRDLRIDQMLLTRWSRFSG
jgi:hypothetical protein